MQFIVNWDIHVLDNFESMVKDNIFNLRFLSKTRTHIYSKIKTLLYLILAKKFN